MPICQFVQFCHFRAFLTIFQSFFAILDFGLRFTEEGVEGQHLSGLTGGYYGKIGYFTKSFVCRIFVHLELKPPECGINNKVCCQLRRLCLNSCIGTSKLRAFVTNRGRLGQTHRKLWGAWGLDSIHRVLSLYRAGEVGPPPPPWNQKKIPRRFAPENVWFFTCFFLLIWSKKIT